MDNELYTFPQNRILKKSSIPQSSPMTFAELVKQQEVSLREFIESYCLEIRKILEIDNLDKMVKDVLEFEEKILKLQNKFSFEGTRIPNIVNFYAHLAPLLLRSLVEYDHSIDLQGQLNQIVNNEAECLKVSLENELYSWQEFLIDNPEI